MTIRASQPADVPQRPHPPHRDIALSLLSPRSFSGFPRLPSCQRLRLAFRYKHESLCGEKETLFTPRVFTLFIRPGTLWGVTWWRLIGSRPLSLSCLEGKGGHGVQTSQGFHTHILTFDRFARSNVQRVWPSGSSLNTQRAKVIRPFL